MLGRTVIPAANRVVTPEEALPITHTPAQALLHGIGLVSIGNSINLLPRHIVCVSNPQNSSSS